jgi:hypothetical protein
LNPFIYLGLFTALVITVVALRHDIVKFRAWRERSRRWRAEGRTPAPEYARDNRLWRCRIAAFCATLIGLVACVIAIYELKGWLIWTCYAFAMVGAAAWSILGRYVR